MEYETSKYSNRNKKLFGVYGLQIMQKMVYQLSLTSFSTQKNHVYDKHTHYANKTKVTNNMSCIKRIVHMM